MPGASGRADRGGRRTRERASSGETDHRGAGRVRRGAGGRGLVAYHARGEGRGHPQAGACTMTDHVQIGERRVGEGEPCYVVAEIGINHNGDIDTARKLIAAAAVSGCDAVKFQKRTVDVVYTAEELAKPRENPFGPTNGHLKRGLEFGQQEYRAIGDYARQSGVEWFASCWDEASVDFMEQFDPPCYKIASASLTDDDLLRHHRSTGRPIIASTGMSSIQEIDHAVEVLGT